jgi:hypothetical protein
MNAFIGRLMWLGLFFFVCVASEYGVGEFSSTSCEPNIGRANLLSVESMMRIVSCLGTMLQMFFYYFTVLCCKNIYRCDPKNKGARSRKITKTQKKKIQSLHALERSEGKKIFFPRMAKRRRVKKN